MTYSNYIKVHDKFIVEKNSDRKEKLPAGSYQVSYIADYDKLFFTATEFNHDELLELPSKEFKNVSSQIDTFLTPDSKQLFEKYGFVYKRSILLHGVPGTGKTCLIDRIANKVVADGGVVLFNPDPRWLPKAFQALSDIQPETQIVVVFEELDQLVKSFEHELLNLLDGEIQRDNVIYLATTNFIKKVPARIMRPGRFSSVVEVKYTGAVARRFYLNAKLGKDVAKEEVDIWVQKTDGFSIDELKETVLSTKCLQIPLDEVVERVKQTKELTKNDKVYDDYEEWIPEGDAHGRHTLKNLEKEMSDVAFTLTTSNMGGNNGSSGN